MSLYCSILAHGNAKCLWNRWALVRRLRCLSLLLPLYGDARIKRNQETRCPLNHAENRSSKNGWSIFLHTSNDDSSVSDRSDAFAFNARGSTTQARGHLPAQHLVNGWHTAPRPAAPQPPGPFPCVSPLQASPAPDRPPIRSAPRPF